MFECTWKTYCLVTTINQVQSRDVEAAISSTASAPNASASASNRAWTLSESGQAWLSKPAAYELQGHNTSKNDRIS